MSSDLSIQVSGVSKYYPIFDHPWQAIRYLISVIWRGKPELRFATRGVLALAEINLTISNGERVGIVGRNGAGKSTLLKLLAGNFPPAAGRFTVNGNIYCLLPGSISFSLDKSTADNARYYLSLFGVPPEEIEARLQEILDFTELGEYFEQPVHNLSLGMRVRAEFAVATAHSADIVIIDEVLGAGDIYWSEKIARRMERLCADGTTLLLVSHSQSQINRYCERAVWIEGGKIVMDGPALEVTKRYEGFLERLSWQTDDVDDKSVGIENAAAEMGNEVLPDSGQTVVRWPGRGDVLVSGVWFNDHAASSMRLDSDDALSIRLRLEGRRSGMYCLRYLLTFWDANGKRVAVIENESDRMEFQLDSIRTRHEIMFWRPSLGLKVGQYSMSITVIDSMAVIGTTSEHAIRQDALYKSFMLEVEAGSRFGSVQPVYRLSLAPE
jgi:ABC-type polysaccharide/polyol phosphate transport system ATPase subunit